MEYHAVALVSCCDEDAQWIGHEFGDFLFDAAVGNGDGEPDIIATLHVSKTFGGLHAHRVHHLSLSARFERTGHSSMAYFELMICATYKIACK